MFMRETYRMCNTEKLTKDIRVCSIMGVNIAEIDLRVLEDFTKEYIQQLSGHYMCVSNVHTTVMAYENEKYKEVQNDAVLAIPDGGPLSSVGRKRGFPKMQRTPGPSYLQNILSISEKYGYRHFFYGSKPETLEKMKSVILEKYPGIQIVGMISPPFRELTAKEDQEYIDMINASMPDFLWVGLGAPKQEYWMAEHRGKIKGFMVGVGAGFDYLAGNIKRAPQWMQNHNLEWLYRLIQDPKRLFKRYLITNIKFIWYACIKGK